MDVSFWAKTFTHSTINRIVKNSNHRIDKLANRKLLKETFLVLRLAAESVDDSDEVL
jgi:hypothetical protein